MTSFNPLAKVLATIALVAGNAAMAQSLDKPFTVVEPEQIQWKDAGKGVKFAVISGDPAKPGP